MSPDTRAQRAPFPVATKALILIGAAISLFFNALPGAAAVAPGVNLIPAQAMTLGILIVHGAFLSQGLTHSRAGHV